MSRIQPIGSIEATKPEIREVVDRMGFLPLSHVVMHNVPGLTEAVGNLCALVFGDQLRTSRQLRNLVAQVASQAAGCRYCWAHTASNAHRSGVDEAKVAAVWEFETSPLFNDAERAALRFAVAAVVPNAVDDDVMTALDEHFDDVEKTELIAAVAVMGFLNRWNDSLATELEGVPRSFAERALSPANWTVGKHSGESG